MIKLIIEYKNADNYQKAVFIVKEVFYVSPGNSTRGGWKHDHWYATGYVNEKEEELSLMHLPKRPESRKDLVSMVHAGEIIDVLINYDMEYFSVND